MKDEAFPQFDATRKPIVLGQCYGYSSTSSGFSKTAIGVAAKVSKTGAISLKILKVHHFLYGKPIDKDWTADAGTVSVRPHMLFPVTLDEEDKNE